MFVTVFNNIFGQYYLFRQYIIYNIGVGKPRMIIFGIRAKIFVAEEDFIDAHVLYRAQEQNGYVRIASSDGIEGLPHNRLLGVPAVFPVPVGADMSKCCPAETESLMRFIISCCCGRFSGK